MTSQDIRTAIRTGKPVVGTWVQLPSPDVAEIIGRLGYDFAAIDLEHGAISRTQLPDLFRALELGGTLPMARILEATKSNIKAALDSGARGLIFPMIESCQQLDEAIAWSLYPGGKEFTNGARGVGFSRGNAFGIDFQKHVTPEDGLGQTLVIVAQIEHIKAIENLDSILSHPRLDAFMIGPYDLSASMGITGQFSHPRFLDALATIDSIAKKHAVARGYHVVAPNPQELQTKIDEGYTFLAYGIDTLFLQLGSRPVL